MVTQELQQWEVLDNVTVLVPQIEVVYLTWHFINFSGINLDVITQHSASLSSAKTSCKVKL